MNNCVVSSIIGMCHARTYWCLDCITSFNSLGFILCLCLYTRKVKLCELLIALGISDSKLYDYTVMVSN